jgi:hypothetical protein
MKLKNKTLLQQLSLAFAPLALFALAPQAHSADYADYAAGTGVAGNTNVGGLYTPAPKPAADSFTGALTGGTVTANLQARYENVDQKNIANKANAATLRLRLGYETAEYNGFGGLVQIEHISANDAFNSRANGMGTRPVVADGGITEINQAYISYSGLPQTRIKFGRQLIRLDNDRWIGNVVWRQNHQTYDGVTAVNTSLTDTTITTGYITNVNRVFSDLAVDSSNAGNFMGNHAMKSPIVNVSYKGLGFAELVGYGYFLDYDRSANGAALTNGFGDKNSTKTIGGRIKGDAPMGDYKLLYTAEYAGQSAYKDNPVDYNAHYTLLEGGVDTKAFQVKLGYEVLSSALASNGTRKSLSTPLATLFAFNGWADVFLVTPANGLQDLYLNARTTVAGTVLGFDFHDYKADHGGNKYGTELDLIASKRIDKTYSIGSRYARFRANGSVDLGNCAACVDTNKLWIYGAMNF